MFVYLDAAEHWRADKDCICSYPRVNIELDSRSDSRIGYTVSVAAASTCTYPNTPVHGHRQSKCHTRRTDADPAPQAFLAMLSVVCNQRRTYVAGPCQFPEWDFRTDRYAHP